MVKKILKQKLKICAIKQGFNSIGEYCKELGISESFLSLVVNGKRNIGIKTAREMIEKTKDMGEYAVKIEDIL